MLALTVPVVMATASGVATEVSLGGYAPPLGISLRVDGLATVFILLTSVVGVCVSAAAALSPKLTGSSGFHPLWLGAWAGLNAVYVTGDLFNAYVGIEVVGLSAIGLVAIGKRASWRAALRYLFIAVPGALLYLVGVGLIAAETGTLDIQQARVALAAGSGAGMTAAAALGFATVGLAMKIALVPMHGWLIPAHANATTVVSPLLSALVIKAGLFILIRFWMWLLPLSELSALAPTVIAWVLAGLGVVALVHGSVMAMRQHTLKRLVAYSTVAQVGYWFLFFPLIVDPFPSVIETRAVTAITIESVPLAALVGTVGMALGHGISKAGLFLAAGFLKDHYGTDEIVKLRGVSRQHPMLFLGMGLCAVGIAGLPFSLSFAGKWSLATAGVASGHYWILVVLTVATLLSAGYLLAFFAPLLTQDDSHDDQLTRLNRASRAKTSRAAFIAPQAMVVSLGILTVVSGFLGAWISQLVEVGVPW